MMQHTATGLRVLHAGARLANITGKDDMHVDGAIESANGEVRAARDDVCIGHAAAPSEAATILAS